MTKNNENTESKQLNPTPWIAGVLLVLGLAVLGGWYWNRTGKIAEVQYKGQYYVSSKELKEQVEIPTGVHPDSIDVIAIMQKIEELPYIKKARINTSPGGTIWVDITERTPVALLINGSQRAYVDTAGVLLPQVLGKTPDVPILYGFDTGPVGDTLKSDAFKQAAAFLQQLQQYKAADATISEVAWNDTEGIVALTNEHGVKLTFGKGTYKDRLRNWETFYREVVRSKGIEAIKSVDLRFEGQIVAREK